ncbi:hypothetical protein [Thermoleptolyngbya sp. PKUAC-SCTB121]|uniref:hypothetical protein n=1 Tax=Thermoleptolyngbya sp. PKUAC-SCTB121 TaxID=2811482 RepID=UPI001962D4FE|nr:hypothetical protein [Thermoleptolyngbya sp. PKUAC-SCTB121]
MLHWLARSPSFLTLHNLVLGKLMHKLPLCRHRQRPRSHGLYRGDRRFWAVT